MKLLISAASPFARKCRVLLREADLMDAVREVDIATSPLSSAPEALAANPTGKIPALIRSDGPALYDSRVITRFLNDHAGANLYPAARLWELLTLEATADAIMEAALLITYESRFRPAAQQSADWTEAQWGKAERAISAINERWMSHLSGPLDMSQIAVSCALSYVDLRHDARGWRRENADLSDWHTAFLTRPAMQETAPPTA